MLSYGASHCATAFTTGSADEKLANTYYDAERVYYQIGDYTNDTATWDVCAARAEAIYRDAYLIPNNHAAPGYWNFTTGLRLDWELKADATSKSSAISLSTNSVYCVDGIPLANTASADLSREVAYCINAYIDAEALGEAHRNRLSQAGADNDLVDQALDHLDQWLVTKDYRSPNPFPDVPLCAGKYRYQPFMVGLTVNALINEYERSGDSRIQAAVKTALDVVWTDAWMAADEAFWYQNCKDNPGDAWPAPVPAAELGTPAPDLNLLLVYGYQWLYERGEGTAYRDKADAIFAGGVTQAWLAGSKQFNQNFIYSFRYVNSRQSFVDVPHLSALGVSAGPTYAGFILGAPELRYEVDCSIVVKEGVTTIETINSTEGLATRHLKTSVALTAGTAYTATQSCTGLASDTNEYAFTTKPAPAGGNRTVPIQSGDPKVIANVARATVRYDDNAALSTPDTAQNTDCANGCTINLTLAAGRYYYRWEWQDVSNNVLAVGQVQELQVP